MITKMIAQDCEIVMGVDVAKAKHNVCVVDARDGHVLHEEVIHQLSPQRYQKLFSRMPHCRITVVYEAGPDGYTLFDVVRALGRQAVVVAPQKHVGPKTDARDACHIARDFLARRTRVVTVPDAHKRAARQVLRTRDQMLKERRRTDNRLASLKRLHGLDEPGLRPVAFDTTGLLDQVQRSLWELRRALNQEIKRLEVILSQLMKQDAEYQALAEELRRLPGVGPVTTWQVLLNVARLDAFGTADRFASYTGLCPRVHNTGETQRHGHITACGPGPLRAALIQAAWASTRCNPDEKAFFIKLSQRRGKRIAIVAVARRLAKKIWRVAKARRDAPPAVDGACGVAPA